MVLIVRMNYDPNAATIDLSIVLPGWFEKVKKLYYFKKEYEVVDEEIPRIKAQIIEQNELYGFGSISHKYSN